MFSIFLYSLNSSLSTIQRVLFKIRSTKSEIRKKFKYKKIQCPKLKKQLLIVWNF